jgi:YidC/Oxa1 family membrane protein insertase
MIVLMGASTFFTQRQLMARNSATNSGNNQFAQQQKVLLYVLPLTFAIFGYRFPLGVLLYWLTTNVWSMGQQYFVIRRMDGGTAAATAGAPPPPSGPAPGAKPVRSTPAPQPGGAPRPGGANRRPAGRNRRNRRRR